MQEDNNEIINQSYDPKDQSQGSEHLSKRERRELKKQQEQEKKEQRQNRKKRKKLGIKVLTAGVVIGIIIFIGWVISSDTHLPPITEQGHIEESPLLHIMTTPIQDTIQRHMLEHADGGGRPGIIIQYNCDDYNCEADLIDKLTSLVSEFPENVYLAPNNYDGKIILTKVGRREVLDAFDETTIRSFINK